jgi:hypothetical protein
VSVVDIEVTYPDGRTEAVTIDAERVIIGSGAHCDLRLRSDRDCRRGRSRRSARIRAATHA